MDGSAVPEVASESLGDVGAAGMKSLTSSNIIAPARSSSSSGLIPHVSRRMGTLVFLRSFRNLYRPGSASGSPPPRTMPSRLPFLESI